jgi:hypothetical protein
MTTEATRRRLESIEMDLIDAWITAYKYENSGKEPGLFVFDRSEIEILRAEVRGMLDEVREQAWSEGSRAQAESHGILLSPGPNPYAKKETK